MRPEAPVTTTRAPRSSASTTGGPERGSSDGVGVVLLDAPAYPVPPAHLGAAYEALAVVGVVGHHDASQVVTSILAGVSMTSDT